MAKSNKNFKVVEEVIQKNFSIGQAGYYIYKKYKDAEGRVFWERKGPIAESAVMGWRKQGLKLWADLTEEEKQLVNILPDAESTRNEWRDFYNKENNNG